MATKKTPAKKTPAVATKKQAPPAPSKATKPSAKKSADKKAAALKAPAAKTNAKPAKSKGVVAKQVAKQPLPTLGSAKSKATPLAETRKPAPPPKRPAAAKPVAPPVSVEPKLEPWGEIVSHRRKKKTIPDPPKRVRRSAEQIQAEKDRKAEERARAVADKEQLKAERDAEKARARLAADKARTEARDAAAKQRAEEAEKARVARDKAREVAAQKRAEDAARARVEADRLKVERDEERERARFYAKQAKARRVEHAARERARAAAEKEAERVAKEKEKAEARAQAKEAAEKAKALALVAAAIKKAEREADRALARQQAAEDKERKAAAKAEAAEAAALARSQEREAHAAARAEAKQTAADEKARAQTQAKEEAAARMAEKKRLSEVVKAIAEHERSETKQLGASSVELTGLWLRVLSSRGRVLVDKRGPTLTDEQLLELAGSTPTEVLSFFRGIGPIEYAWALGESDTPKGSFELLELVDLSALLESAALADALLARLRASFATPELTESLRASGLPRFVSRADIVGALVAKELSEKQANALVDWAGPDIQWLVSGSETEEGRRRATLLQKRRASGSGKVDVELLEQWTSGPALEKNDFAKVAKEHEAFLASGGGGGSFRVVIQAGLPKAIYSKTNAPSGQAQLELENVGALKGAGLKLASANFCGVRGDNVNLSRAELTQSTFAYAQLEGASFSGAMLRGVDFSRACLRGADFRKADLTEVSFEDADLRGAQFAGSITNRTKFGGANVQGIKY